MLFQKAKVDWINEGDGNFVFYKVLKGRIHRSRVEEICGENNVRYTGDQVLIQFVNHFQKFLGCQPDKEYLELDKRWFHTKIDSQTSVQMVEKVPYDEIKSAIFDINDNKAPGPDGFTAKLFKKSWDVVLGDVCSAVKEFFDKVKLLGELNATLITLVPKINTPNKVSDFRPIACCNVAYKCISKLVFIHQSCTNKVLVSFCS